MSLIFQYYICVLCMCKCVVDECGERLVLGMFSIVPPEGHFIFLWESGRGQQEKRQRDKRAEDEIK